MQAHHHCPLSPIYTLSSHHWSSHESCLSKAACESGTAKHHKSLPYHMSLCHLTFPETSTTGKDNVGINKIETGKTKPYNDSVDEVLAL